MRQSLKSLVAGLSLALPAATFAGTTITSNLPTGTTIVNIDARSDGAGGYGSGQAEWYSPFGASMPTVTVQPGTYTFRIASPADAAALYPALTPAQTSQMYTAWTYNNPWLTNYVVFDSAAATNSSIPQLLYGAPSTTGYSDAATAYNASISNGRYNSFYAGIADGSLPLVTTYTFTSPETLLFVIPDNGVSDNFGGLSVIVSPLPEPSTLLLGALPAAALRRRRSNAR